MLVQLKFSGSRENPVKRGGNTFMFDTDDPVFRLRIADTIEDWFKKRGTLMLADDLNWMILDCGHQQTSFNGFKIDARWIQKN